MALWQPFSNQQLNELVDSGTTVFWFRRDLRVDDNAGLYHALKDSGRVVPIFIFDTVILERLEDTDDRRVDFIHQSLLLLKSALERFGSSLLILHGDPVHLFDQINPRAVYTNHDYEPYARTRDETVARRLASRNIPFRSFKDHVIFEKQEVVKDDGKPYSVFTPYSRRWKAALSPFYTKAYPVLQYVHQLAQMECAPFPALEEIGFRSSGLTFPRRSLPVSIIRNYDRTRNFPAANGTTRLSVHIRFGTVSIRQVVAIALPMNETWLNELIWRDFYHMITWHFPATVTHAFKPSYDRIPWRNDEAEFGAWCRGATGYPIVDAGMRELNATGFMHNRVRMVVASFLVKHLLIDWRWGEAYFARRLLDFDLAANNGGWQWAAGSGCDAAPYFRIFNPTLQSEKFDPGEKYIRRWVPEAGNSTYPSPIVDHAMARDRALSVYRAALGR